MHGLELERLQSSLEQRARARNGTWGLGLGLELTANMGLRLGLELTANMGLRLGLEMEHGVKARARNGTWG